ncbi:hypothetical protein ZWY2020_052057 [Hordeum vulgare]|nr:hypothetical protein ZWY2020_052057 [Hordeum vulgare]
MTLNFMMSSHPNLDLWLLAPRRVGTEAALVAVAEPLAVRATDVTFYAAWDMYVPERSTDGPPLPKEDNALAVNNPEGSTSEMGDEETDSSIGAYADARGEADTRASVGATRDEADGASTN